MRSPNRAFSTVEGLIFLEAAAAAVVTIVSGAAALLLGIVVLVGFVASA